MPSTPEPAEIGRRLALTPEIEERILNAVRGGSYLDDAAAFAGIGERTLFRWLARGREAEEAADRGEELPPREETLRQFWQAIQRARADAVLRNLTLIQQAAQGGSWQAAAWYLERTNPRKWGRHETVEIDGLTAIGSGDRGEASDLLDERISRMRERSRIIIEAREVPEDAAAEVLEALPPALRNAQ